MLRGMTTITLFTDDLDAARRWYTDLLGVEPYFERSVDGTPAYLEFRVGDYEHELGILDRRFAPGASADHTSGPVTYWAVDDVHAAYQRLLALGASSHQPPIERGPGFVTASVVDPFGNLVGVMFNRHYLEVLGR
jgi:predicted enzyme related to lactoylglutathione lyase